MATTNGTKQGMKANMLGSTGRTLIRWIGGALALATIAVTSPADAANVTGQSVTVVNFNYWNSTPQLVVQLGNGVTYFANVVGGNECGTVPSPPMEVAKTWHSLLSAALLSGKNVNLAYTDCGGYHWINEVALLQ